MNAQNVFLRLAVLLALSSVTAWAGEPHSAPPGRHIWDHAAVARCSSTYQREVITDPQAKDGQAARLSGEANFVSLHDEIPIAPGRSRFTVRLRLPQGGRFATDFEAGGRGFQSRARSSSPNSPPTAASPSASWN